MHILCLVIVMRKYFYNIIAWQKNFLNLLKQHVITALLLHVIRVCLYYVSLGHDSEALSYIWFTCIRVI